MRASTQRLARLRLTPFHTPSLQTPPFHTPPLHNSPFHRQQRLLELRPAPVFADAPVAASHPVAGVQDR